MTGYISGISLTHEEEQHFVEASVSEKQGILLDQSTSAAKAVEFLSLCERSMVDCTGVVTDEVANKVRTMCEGKCEALQDVVLTNVTTAKDELEKMYDQEINKTREKIAILTRTSVALTELSRSAQLLREEMHTPERLTERLHKQINKAAKDKVLDPQVAFVLKQKVESSLVIDPSAPQNSVQSIIENVNKASRQANYEQEAKLKGLNKKRLQARNYMETTRREIKAMSNTDKLSKSADAVGGILTAVNKFQTGDEVQIVSGCLDIANAAAQFLPPPASLVTGTAASVFNLISGAPPDPSNQQVIDEVKNAINATINAGFAKQEKFLQKKFEKHRKFITEEFQSLESTMKDEFNKAKNATKEGFHKLENALNKGFEGMEVGFQKLADGLNQGFEGIHYSTNVGFADLRIFIDEKFTEDNLRQVKNDALAQMEAVEEKLIFIEQYRDVKVDVNIANLIAREVAALSSTHYSASSKTTFEDICPGILDDDYAVSKSHSLQRHYCATLLYTYLIVEQDRSIVLNQLIVLLEKTSLSKSKQGYLEVYQHRKDEVKEFVKRNVLKDELGCSLLFLLLTDLQRTEISNYIESLSTAFIGSIDAFKKKNDCPRKFIQTSHRFRHSFPIEVPRRSKQSGGQKRNQTRFRFETDFKCLNS